MKGFRESVEESYKVAKVEIPSATWSVKQAYGMAGKVNGEKVEGSAGDANGRRISKLSEDESRLESFLAVLNEQKHELARSEKVENFVVERCKRGLARWTGHRDASSLKRLREAKQGRAAENLDDTIFRAAIPLTKCRTKRWIEVSALFLRVSTCEIASPWHYVRYH